MHDPQEWEHGHAQGEQRPGGGADNRVTGIVGDGLGKSDGEKERHTRRENEDQRIAKEHSRDGLLADPDRTQNNECVGEQPADGGYEDQIAEMLDNSIEKMKAAVPFEIIGQAGT